MKKTLILCCALSLIACTGHDHDHGEPNIVISDARVRLPLPGRNITAGYFQLSSDQADTLLAVSSPLSGRTELHNHIDDGGIMRMRRVEGGIDIPAGGEVIFKPGGFHVMLFDAQITEDTKDIALTFDFEHAPDVTVIADIMTGVNSHGSDSHGSDSKGSDSHGSDSQSHGSDK